MRSSSEGFRTRMFGGADMARLPLYDPQGDRRAPHDERDFVETVREASALIIASPGYHGSISGVVKNALDLLEETARDERPVSRRHAGRADRDRLWLAGDRQHDRGAALDRPCAARLADAVRRRDQHADHQVRR